MKARKNLTRARVVAADRLRGIERKALPVGWQSSPFDQPVANYFLVCYPAADEIVLYPIRLDYLYTHTGLERPVVYVGPAPGRDELPLPYSCATALLRWCRRIKKLKQGPVLLWGVVHSPTQYDYLHALTGGIYPNYYSPAPRSLMPLFIELGRRHFTDRFQALNATVEPIFPRAYVQPPGVADHFFAQRNPHYQRGDGLLVAMNVSWLSAGQLLLRSAWAQYRPQRFWRKALERAAVWRGGLTRQTGLLENS